MSCFSLIAGRWSKLEVHRALWIANLKICWRFCTTDTPPVEAACRPAVSLRVLLLARQVGSCRPVLAIGTELEIARWQRNPR
jgi:hypothetical protein